MIWERFLGRLRRDESGTSMLEFALVLPFLALLVVAMVDFGRGVSIAMALESSARAGAEYGSLFPSDPGGIEVAALDVLGPRLAPSAINIVRECRCGTQLIACELACDGNPSARYVRVEVSYGYQPILPYPGTLKGVSMQGSANFRVK